MLDAQPTKSTLPLAPPTMWTRTFSLVCLAVTGLLLSLLYEIKTQGFEIAWTDWALPVGALALLLIFRRLWVPRKRRRVRFHGDHIELPRGPNTRRTTRIAYQEIRGVVPLSSRGQPALVIDGERDVVILVASDFDDAEAWRLLLVRTLEHIHRLPNSTEQLLAMREMALLSQRTSSTRPVFTRRLFWVIATAFAAQFLLGHPVDLLSHLYFGSNSSIMVLEAGQWWRIVTANLLHGGVLHFAVNAFALYFLGTYSERLFGQARTIIIILATALAGALASLLGPAIFSVGISTALFGLIGAYLALHLRFGAHLPPPYRQTRRWWIFILGVNGLLSIAVPMIDGWGHGGGFIVGLFLGWWMLRGQTSFEPRRPAGKFTHLVAALLLAIFAAASVTAVAYHMGDHPEDELLIARELERRALEEDPAQAVQAAWQWATYGDVNDTISSVLLNVAYSAAAASEDPFVRQRAYEIYQALGNRGSPPGPDLP